nr:hypothetical protein [Tanacetum cinerariifolium]
MRILENLKEVQDAVKGDPALNKKVLEATEDYTKNITNLTELLTLVKTFDFSSFNSIVESLKAIVDAQNDHLAKWAKSSINLAWSVGPRLTNIEHTRALMQTEISSLQKDTSDFKNTITEILCAFKGQSTPSSSVPKTTLAITECSFRQRRKDEASCQRSKAELIKVDQEEATKAGVDPKILASAKGGQEFRKIQDAKIKVHNKEHSKKIKRTQKEEN